MEHNYDRILVCCAKDPWLSVVYIPDPFSDYLKNVILLQRMQIAPKLNEIIAIFQMIFLDILREDQVVQFSVIF